MPHECRKKAALADSCGKYGTRLARRKSDIIVTTGPKE